MGNITEYIKIKSGQVEKNRIVSKFAKVLLAFLKQLDSYIPCHYNFAVLYEGLFLVVKGPLGRSLRSFTRTAHAAHSLRSAPLRYARSIHGLAHSLRSLPRGTVEIHDSVFMLRMCSMGTNDIVVVTRNTP